MQSRYITTPTAQKIVDWERLIPHSELSGLSFHAEAPRTFAGRAIGMSAFSDSMAALCRTRLREYPPLWYSSGKSDMSHSYA